MADIPNERKFGMINLWRHRCSELKRRGVKIDPKACQDCNDVAKAIEKDIKTCDVVGDFGFLGQASGREQ